MAAGLGFSVGVCADSIGRSQPGRRPRVPGVPRSANGGERVDDLGGVARPVRRVLLKQPGDQGGQVVRDIAAQRGTGAGSARRAGSAPRTSVPPSNGGAPASISYSTQPRAYRSTAAVTVCWRACSGAMYLAVPTVTSELVSAAVHVVEDEADAEVQDLHHAVGGEHHVGRLEVPVDHASPVRAASPAAICAPIAAAHATGSGRRPPRRAACQGCLRRCTPSPGRAGRRRARRRWCAAGSRSTAVA